MNKCTWREDAEGNWHTDCGGCFILWDDAPSDNDMRWCCYCGKPLVEVEYTEPTMEPPEDGTMRKRITAEQMIAAEYIGLKEILAWAAWAQHTEGTEASSSERAIRIAYAIIEADEEGERT